MPCQISSGKVCTFKILFGVTTVPPSSDIEELVADGSKKLPLTDKLSAGTGNETDAFCNQLFNDLAIYSGSSIRVPSLNSAVNIGCNKFDHSAS